MKDLGAGPVHAVAHKRHGRHQWRTDFRWSAGWVSIFAGFYSSVVLIKTVLRWNTDWPRYHTTTWRILAGYWGAAAIFAVILAVLRPWLGRRGGAALAGLLGGAAVYGIVGFVSERAAELDVVVGTAILGGLAGLGLAVVTYDDDHSEPMSDEREGHRIAVMIAGGLVLIFLVWAMTNPPLCWLGGKYCR